MKKLFNLKFLSILFLLNTIHLTASFYFYPEVFSTIKPYYFSGLAYFFSVIFAPITEEFIFRYWAYGKNIQLQFSLFLTFILYMIIDLIQNYVFEIFYFTNNFEINIIFRNSLVLLIGLIIFYFIKKYNIRIPNIFYTFINSHFTFYFIVILFAMVHLYHTQFNEENYLLYLDYFIISYLITRHAREFGIYFSILLHTMNNSISNFGELLQIRSESKNFVSNQLFISHLLFSIILIIVYLIQFLKAKPLSLNQR